MKRTKIFVIGIAAGALALTLAACGTPISANSDAPSVAAAAVVQTQQQATANGQQAGGGQQGAANQTQGGQGDMAANLPPAGDVDEQEIADLLWMREEEKLARDVYITLGETWSLPVFSNISQAEQQHMDAVGALLDRYEIQDPVGDNGVGVFTNPELQALYDQLVEQGSQSATDALMVGGAIEELDILDLQKAIANTDNADIQQVYTSLNAGSENHLRAFVGNLERQSGESYSPQYMDQGAYDAIMAGSNGNGQGGNGQGNGGNGQGNGGNGQGQGKGKGGNGNN